LKSSFNSSLSGYSDSDVAADCCIFAPQALPQHHLLKNMKHFLKFASLICLFVTSKALEGNEEACPTGEIQSCESCLESDCGYVTDAGDCVTDCSTVTDSPCYSFVTNAGEDSASICAMAASTTADGPAVQEEVMCGAFASGEKATCVTCLEAGCGWTADDGDCLQDCATVNDGAVCLDLSGGQASADVCSADTAGATGSSTAAVGPKAKLVAGVFALVAAAFFL
jgi:hypothetical protein